MVHTCLDKNFQQSLSAFLHCSFPTFSEKKQAQKLFLGGTCASSPAAEHAVAQEGAPASRKARHSSWLFTFACGEDFTTLSLKVTAVPLQGRKNMPFGFSNLSPEPFILVFDLHTGTCYSGEGANIFLLIKMTLLVLKKSC